MRIKTKLECNFLRFPDIRTDHDLYCARHYHLYIQTYYNGNVNMKKRMKKNIRMRL